MRRKRAFSILVLLVTVSMTYASQFIPRRVVEKVEAHAVAVAVYYPFYDFSEWRQKYRVYFGSGLMLRDDHVLTAGHVVKHKEEGIGEKVVWVFKKDLDHAIKAEVVCVSDSSEDDTNDYAVLKLKESLGLPGMKLAREEAEVGDWVVYCGSMVKAVFLTRFALLSELKYHFTQTPEGQLKLLQWGGAPYLALYPGGPGDSGTPLVNRRGRIVGMVYFGIRNVTGQTLLLSNSLKKLKEFFRKNRLMELVR